MSFFKIQPGEGKKTLIFASIGLLINGGLTLGICSTDALFLAKLGSDQLPFIYVMLPFAMMVLTPLSSYTQSRFKIETVFRWTLFITAITAIGLGISIQLFKDQTALYVILYAGKLFTVICYIGIYTIFWNYVDAYFSIVEGKRLYGLINAGSCVGIILFGSLVVFLSDTTSISNAYYLWAIASLLGWPIVRYVARTFPNLEETEQGLETEEVLPDNVIRTTLDAIKQSKFAFFVALLYFLLPILTYTNEYLCYTVFSQQGDQQAIAALLGKLYGTANIFNLLISLFAFNALVSRLGVRNLVLVQPFVYFFVFIWYYGDLSFASAIFGFFAYQSILPSIDNNNANLLFNALPANQKRSIRTFIEGLGEPIAVAISGGFLLFFINVEAKAKVAVSAVGMAALVGIVAYVINQLYVSGIHTNLRKNWADILELKNAAFQAIRNALRIRPNAADKRGDRKAESLNTFAMRFRVAPEEITPELVVSFFNMAAEQQAEARILLERSLASPSQELLEAFKAAIPKIPDEKWTWACDILMPYGVIPSLVMDSCSDSSDENLTRFRKEVCEIVSSRRSDRIPYLLHHLRSESTRLDSLRGLNQLIHNASSTVATEVTRWIPKATSEALILILQILKTTKHAASVKTLFRSGISFTRNERRLMTELILAIGARTVPVLLDVIQDSALSFSTRSLALNALASLSFPQINSIWRELIETEMENLAMHDRMIHAIQSSENEIGGFCLKRAHADLRNQSLEWILEILSVIGRIPDYALLLHSLGSQSPKEQANGIEIIVEGVGIPFFKRIEPYLQSYIGLEISPTQPEGSKIRPMQLIAHALSSQKELLILAACHACFRGEMGLDKEDLWIALRKQSDTPLILKCVGEYLVEESTLREKPCRIALLHELLQHPILERISSPDLLSLLPLFDKERIQTGESFSGQKCYLSYGGMEHPEEEMLSWLRALENPQNNGTHARETIDHITIHCNSIQRIIQIYPQIGFELLKLNRQPRIHA